MLIYDGKQITMPNKINLTLKSFYENLFQKDIKKSVSDIETFLSPMQLLTTKITPNVKLILPKIISCSSKKYA